MKPNPFEVKFGHKDEPSFFLSKSPDTIIVRTHSKKSIEENLRQDLAKCRRTLCLPDLGVEAYQILSTHKTPLDHYKNNWQQLEDVDFAATALVDSETQEPVLYSDRVFIKFIDALPATKCEAILQKHALDIQQTLSYASNAYFVTVSASTGKQVFKITLDLLAHPDVEYCHPELIRERKSRVIHPNQWHLKPTTVTYQVDIDQSANVEKAHATTQGEGIIIAIIDDAIDIDHPEFMRPGKIIAPYFSGVYSDDPRPQSQFESHGTACAGVACADGLHGASGVAPKAQLMPIKLSDGLGSAAEADAFTWAADHGADVISCSWGPPDGTWYLPNDPRHRRMTPLPASTRLAMDYAVKNGRQGKGCVILFAAGNGNESVDLDGYAGYSSVMAIAACNDRGWRSAYSDFGQAIWCCFPSNDAALPGVNPAPRTQGIWTTDVMGANGYNPSGDQSEGDLFGNYTNNFGGTSSAAPGAAGSVALMLSANPALSWQEVRNILKETCEKIDKEDGDYNKTGHSTLYGYGRVNAEKAVLRALKMRKHTPDKVST